MHCFVRRCSNNCGKLLKYYSIEQKIRHNKNCRSWNYIWMLFNPSSGISFRNQNDF